MSSSYLYEIDNDRWDQLAIPDYYYYYYYAISCTICGKLILIAGHLDLIATNEKTDKVSKLNNPVYLTILIYF